MIAPDYHTPTHPAYCSPHRPRITPHSRPEPSHASSVYMSPPPTSSSFLTRSLAPARLLIAHPIAAAISISCFLATGLIMYFAQGRVAYCACRRLNLWSGNVWSSHCSQHVLDPYSFTHFSHGLILYFFFSLLAPYISRPSHPARFAATLVVAAAWEILENSPFIINRYRTATMSLDYLGDSVTNALGDILCAALGYLAAHRLGLRNTTILFILIELLLLILIRDNLTTNIIMLIHPIEALKTWQSAGHAPA